MFQEIGIGECAHLRMCFAAEPSFAHCCIENKSKFWGIVYKLLHTLVPVSCIRDSKASPITATHPPCPAPHLHTFRSFLYLHPDPASSACLPSLPPSAACLHLSLPVSVEHAFSSACNARSLLSASSPFLLAIPTSYAQRRLSRVLLRTSWPDPDCPCAGNQ